MKPKSILAFDIDGTLTKRNTYVILPEGLSKILNSLSEKAHYFLPVTGKPAPYTTRIIDTNHMVDRGVIAENAGVYRKPGSKTVEIYEKDSVQAIYELKKALELDPKAGNICDVFIDGKTHKIPVDPEDYSIFTLFTDPRFISHRWQFEQTITTDEVFNSLKKLIESKWEDQLVVLPPFPDGGIQVIRKTHTGKIIDKSLITDVVKVMYDLESLPPIAMFGDGHNDIPAMTPKEVIPLTFINAHPSVIDFVKQKGGYISESPAPEQVGIIEGLYWLANNNFFNEDSVIVKKLLTSNNLI